MELGSQPKPSGWHISQLLHSKVTSQILLHFLGLEWARKTVKYIRVKPWEGSQIPLEGAGRLLHYSCSRPKSSVAKPCSFCILQIRKRLCHLWLCVLLQKRKLMLKEHVLKEYFSSPLANGAAVISFRWPWDQNWQSQPGSRNEALQRRGTNSTKCCIEHSVAGQKKFTEKCIISWYLQGREGKEYM